MVASESLVRMTLTPADVAGGLALSTAAGWNQTPEDWRLFIGHGDVVGLKDEAGTLVATAAALPYGGGQGWISMVLVHPSWRQRGLATQLLADGVKALQARGVTPVLDATPAGAPVYRRLGFADGFALTRWEGDARALPLQVAARVREAGAHDIDAICALDAQVTGLDRAFLLRDVLARDGAQAVVMRDGSGFAVTRPGTRATQIGPLVAAHEDDAQALLEAALERIRSQSGGRVFLDLPDRWSALAQWLQARGFARQRPFVRMSLSSQTQTQTQTPAPHARAHDRQFLLAGPEFG